jgi:hypothetical protein
MRWHRAPRRRPCRDGCHEQTQTADKQMSPDTRIRAGRISGSGCLGVVKRGFRTQVRAWSKPSQPLLGTCRSTSSSTTSAAGGRDLPQAWTYAVLAWDGETRPESVRELRPHFPDSPGGPDGSGPPGSFINPRRRAATPRPRTPLRTAVGRRAGSSWRTPSVAADGNPGERSEGRLRPLRGSQ